MKLFLPFLFFLLFSSTVLSQPFVQASPSQAQVSVLVYPNPSTEGIFSVELNTTSPTLPISVKIYDLIGNVLYVKRVVASTGLGKEKIALDHLPKGVYLLEIGQGDRKKTLRLSYI